MWVSINGFDQSANVQQDTIMRSEALGDPQTTCNFDVYDAGSALTITPFGGEVLLLDDSPTAIADPTCNLLLNPGLLSYQASNYFYTGSGGPLISMAGSPPTTITFSNANGSTFLAQQVQLGLIVPGAYYIFSAYLQVTSPLSGGEAVMQILFLDGAGNQTGISSINIVPTSTNTRYSLFMQAPLGTISAQVLVGGQSTVPSNNSGVIAVSVLQFESMLFSGEGVAYPTPDCIPGQPNCMALPNGTVWRGTRWFAGVVQSSNREYVHRGTASGPNRTHHLTCIGPEWRLETSILINKSYSGQYDDQIIQDMLTTAFSMPGRGTGQVLPWQTITGNNVVRNTLITDTLSFDGMTVREGLNTIANLTNCVFSVDYLSDLHYTTPNYNAQGFGLTDGAPQPLASPPLYAMYDFNIDQDGSQLRNRVQVNGGNYSVGVSPPQQFTGTGAQTTFTLNHQPDAIQSITVGGTAQNMAPTGQGTLGVGGLQVQWDKTTPQIKFATAPASGASVIVTYTYPSPVRIRAWGMASIGQFASTIGGGTFDSKIEDSNLVTPAAANQRAEAEIQQYGLALLSPHFKTNQAVTAGMVIPITSTLEGFTAQPFILQKVQATILRGNADGLGILEYACDAGAYQPTMLDLYRNTHKALNRSNKTATLPLLTETFFYRDTLGYVETYFNVPSSTPTPLWTYGTQVASGTLSSAGQLASSTGGADALVNTHLGTATGYGELYALGTSGLWSSLGSIGAPSGYGFLWDVTTLEGHSIVAGSWTPALYLNIGSGSITADIYVRAYKRSSGGVYTSIGSMSLLAQTISSTKTLYSPASASLAAMAFATGDKLYLDCWLDVTANTVGSGTLQVHFHLASTTSGVADDMQCVTPGWL